MFEALARTVTRRPVVIVVGAVLFAVVAGTVGGSVAKVLKPFGFDDPASENVRAKNQLQRATGADTERTVIVLARAQRSVRDPAVRTQVERLAIRAQRDPAVAQVLTTYRTKDPAMISKDRRATYLVVTLKSEPDNVRNATAERLKHQLTTSSGLLRVSVGGRALVSAQIGDRVEKDLVHAELVAVPLLFVLSFWVFRGLIAAALPLLVGGLTIVTTFLCLRLLSEATELSIFALNLVTGLGLGLSIDYSLFVLSRYREEIAHSGPGFQAMARTLGTAGRTVLFSGITVAAALASLLVFPQRFLYSMGVGGSLVVVVGLVVSLLVLPAVLVLLGRRVNSLAPRRWQRALEESSQQRTSGGWYRLSQFVMRRPLRIALVCTVGLLALGIPFLGIKFVQADASVLPKSASGRQVSDLLKADFPPHRDTPIDLVFTAPAGRTAGSRLAAHAERVGKLDGVAAVGRPQRLGAGTWSFSVISDSNAFSGRSQSLVRALRAARVPYPQRVGGASASFLDQRQSLGDHLPYALAIVVLVTLIVLFLMTGSVILPVKAVIMNFLTVSAAFGLLVLIFQDGRFQGFLSYTSQGALDMSQPILLAVLAFGLSTDYGVFLLTRIKEARDRGAGERESVALGLQRTGRIVTAAALLFCVALGAFATSQIVFVKELGVGTALAVMIDATIVRALLVPSLMALLGRWNWWAPGPLRRLHSRLGFSEA